MKLSFFTELFNRLKLEAPLFHQKLISFGKWLLGVAIALTTLPAAYEQLFPKANIDLSLLATISSYAGLAGLLISLVASTAVKSPDKLNLDKNKDVNL